MSRKTKIISVFLGAFIVVFTMSVMTGAVEKESMTESVRLDKYSFSTQVEPQDEEEEASIQFDMPVMYTPGFATQTAKTVDPQTYHVNVGDSFVLTLTKKDNETSFYELQVVPQGKLLLPFIGEIEAKQKLLADLEKEVVGIYRKSFSDISASFLLRELGLHNVTVAGAVKRPGVFGIDSVTRLSAVIQMAGGVMEFGSMRDVSVVAGDKSERYNLVEFFQNGDMSNNPYVPQGAIVKVPPRYGQVIVRGEVNMPGRYEIVEGDTLADIVGNAFGFTSLADRERIILKRYVKSSGGANVYRKQALAENGLEFALKDRDVVFVPSYGEAKNGVVTIKGAVGKPGTYEAYDGMTVADLVYEAGGIDGSELPDKAYVFSHNRENNVTKLEVDMSSFPSMVPLELKAGDAVFVVAEGRKLDMVSVEGRVLRPGYYPFSDGMTAYELIMMAGGIDFGLVSNKEHEEKEEEEAGRKKKEQILSLGDSFVLRQSGEGAAKDRQEMIGLRLDRLVMERDMAFDMELRPGDRIVIPTDSDYVLVRGFVSNPGIYDFNANKDALYYVSQAGISSEADIKTIAIQRVSGEIVRATDAVVYPGDIVSIKEKASARNKRNFQFYTSTLTTLLVILNYIDD